MGIVFVIVGQISSTDIIYIYIYIIRQTCSFDNKGFYLLQKIELEKT